LDVDAIALWLTVSLNVGLRLPDGDVGALLVSALVLGLVNAVLRPLMIVLTLPLTVLTLGGFLLIVNALSLGVVAALTPLDVSGFGGAVLSALILTVFSALLSRLFRDDDRRIVRV
jgi:Predicted membrane protein